MMEVEKELEDMDEKIKELYKELSVREGSKRLAIGKIGSLNLKEREKS